MKLLSQHQDDSDTAAKVVVPHFGVGQTDGVPEYVEAALTRFFATRGSTIPPEAQAEIREAFMGALAESAATMEANLTAGMTEPIEASRTLQDRLSPHLILPESELTGSDNLQQAFDYMEQGGNVLLIQNHRSGADTLIMETLVQREFGNGVTQPWGYMAGHAVNLYLIPLLVTNALRRFQIFSAKYQSMAAEGNQTMQATGNNEAQMGRQNLRAIMALKKYTRPGGKLVVLYPEGGRGDHGMKRAEGKTMKVPEEIAKSSPNGLMILPTYVDGATSILPVARGHNEYNEFIEHVRPGVGTLNIGKPVGWGTVSRIAETADAVAEYASRFNPPSAEAGNANSGTRFLERDMVADSISAMIAELAPRDDEMGAYRDPAMRKFLLCNF